jgi:4-hydroxythreonine-4-phosphate dehydrogenase
MSAPMSKPIAITQGDAAGIGPEIIAKLFHQHPGQMQGCFVVGDAACMQQALRVCGSALAVQVIEEGALQHWPQSLGVPVLQVVPPLHGVELGRLSAAAGRAAAQAVTWAARAALRGEIAALVTAPVHKEALALAGVPFPGHTELLQHEAACHAGVTVAEMPVRMMLANPELRTVLVSIHMGLRQALDAVTTESVLETITITAKALGRVQPFASGAPLRIAVAGLNPHAGENGLFGREEIDMIAPAIAKARALGWTVSGPMAPDTVFMRARRGEFDVVVAMYHDQGLIPVKYLGVEQGVNVTLGLPLVRTSPDHGTAFDIAGTGLADPSSLLAALHMAKNLIS